MNDVVSSSRASVTPSTFPITAQPTQSVSTHIPLQVRLAVIQSQAQIIWGGSIQREVQQAQSADIKINNGIEMVKPDGQSQQSYGILYLPDFVNVELFANTKVFLTNARQSPTGSADLTLDLENGHMFVHLNQERTVQVTVQTPHATIKTLTHGAEFDVCRSGELTCVMVKRGIVELDVQGRRDIVRAGSATVILGDQPLSPVVCAPAPTFITWEEHYRQSANAPALQEEIAKLPQTACPVTADGLPLHARILYEDEFTSVSSGWEQGQFGPFTAGYVRSSGARYYQVQAQGIEEQYLTFVPDERDYEDVNIEIKTRTESQSKGDFRYGIIFRRSGEQYYAFVVSPFTKAWYFLKSSSSGLQILKYGIEKQVRGFEGQDTLQVESYGPAFLIFINGHFIDWIMDSDYARGEVGLFVDIIDNPDARISFNSITIWDIPAPILGHAQGENCFNAADDDDDGWIDQADPNCNIQEAIASISPTPSPLPSTTPGTIQTPTAPPATNPPVPTPTNRPPATQPPLPLPTLPVPTVVLPLPTLPLPLPTIVLPLPTISLPLPLIPPAGTPTQ